jgi:hypothetical protein
MNIELTKIEHRTTRFSYRVGIIRQGRKKSYVAIPLDPLLRDWDLDHPSEMHKTQRELIRAMTNRKEFQGTLF